MTALTRSRARARGLVCLADDELGLSRARPLISPRCVLVSSRSVLLLDEKKECKPSAQNREVRGREETGGKKTSMTKKRSRGDQ